jgi:hypothetical protein
LPPPSSILLLSWAISSTASKSFQSCHQRPHPRHHQLASVHLQSSLKKHLLRNTAPSQFPGPTQPDLIHLANPVVHPITGEHITSYEKLAKDPITRDVWTTAFGKELGGLAQGDNKTGAAGTDTVFFMTHNEIQNIPKDRTVTYARVVVDYCPQKEDPNRVRITVGGNLIDYPGELTTRTADLSPQKYCGTA